MLKICLCSDNHGDMDSLQQVLSENPACDYYLHCGDSQFSPDEIRPFISIRGNNDWDYDYPKQLILEIGGHRILLIHGHGYTYQMDQFARKARSEHADVVFFGSLLSLLTYKTTRKRSITSEAAAIHMATVF